jgi:murein hydrolase activator
MPVPRDRTELVGPRRTPLGHGLIAVLFFAILQGVGPARGQTQAQNQAQNQTQTQRAAVLAGDVRDRLRGIRQQLIETARITQAREAVVARAEERLTLLKAHHAVGASDLSVLRGKLASLTAAIQRLARRPPEAILTSPRPPLETARAMMLVRFLVPSIKTESDQMRGELTKLEALNHRIRTEQEHFLTANKALEERRDELDQLIEKKNALWLIMSETKRPSAAQTDQLARTAATLADLFAALKKHGSDQATATSRLKTLIKTGPTIKPPPRPRNRPETVARGRVPASTRPSGQTVVAPASVSPKAGVPAVPASGSFATHKGRLTFPAIGSLVGRFGETDEVGLTAKGITVQTRPNAPVVAAYDGKVIYAGPFRGYGRIIIIEHGHGFLTLLAGLDRIDVQTGQGLLAGEPVGTMRGADGIGDARSRHLYIELRQDGAPVDPLAWLSTERDTAIQ